MAGDEVGQIEGVPGAGVLETLAALVDKSLISHGASPPPSPRGPSPVGGSRFAMLQTIRAYALERLAARPEAAQVGARHSAYYHDLAERAAPQLIGAEQLSWVALLETELGNVRIALAWAAANDATDGLRLAAALWHFWAEWGHLHEGSEWLEALLARSGARTAERARALYVLGHLCNFRGERADARRYHEESVAIGREVGALDAVGYALMGLGDLTAAGGDLVGVAPFLEESLALFRQTGAVWGIAAVLNNTGNVAQLCADHAAAEALYRESLALFQDLGSSWNVAVQLVNLASLAFDRGAYAEARDLSMRSLTLFEELGEKHIMTYALDILAAVAGSQGAALHAARLFGAAEALRRGIGVALQGQEEDVYRARVAAARAEVDAVAWTTAWTEGQHMRPEEAMALYND